MKKKQVVLAVDDEPRNIRILQVILAENVDFHAAASGEEALKAMEVMVPDLVLLDIMMPGMDGYELCRRIRASERLNRTRIILISGKAMTEEKLKGYEVGADDYITKPFVPEELEAKAKVFLQLVEAQRDLAEVNKSLEEKVRTRTEQLVKVERAAFVGTHTAEIVHNINNPLTVLKASVNSIISAKPDCVHAARAAKAVERLQEIVRSILAASRQDGKDQVQEISLNDVITNEVKLLEAEQFFKYEVKLQLQLGTIPSVRGRYTHFSQSLGNLIRNAVDSLFERPEKTLSIRSAVDGDNIRIEIEDSGCGISQENLAKIFEPFFTTKPLVGKSGQPSGTGLGLPSVKRMLEAYGAKIEISSQEGAGTKVKVSFPSACWTSQPVAQAA